MELIKGTKIRDNILNNLRKDVGSLSFPPIFCDILVGDDPVSLSYVRIKEKISLSIGVKFKLVHFKNNTTTEDIVNEINNLNKVPHMCGIIVQLPLPSHIDTNLVLDSIDPILDVDCLGNHNNANFYNGISTMGYPTALACMRILDSIPINLSDKKIVVLGQGKLVGLPVSYLLNQRNLNVITINSRTDNSSALIKEADVIISAIGRGKFITKDMIKKGVAIIDAGTSEENGSLVGDVDIGSVSDFVSYITPTPGGVGPVTVAILLSNVLKVAKMKKYE